MRLRIGVATLATSVLVFAGALAGAPAASAAPNGCSTGQPAYGVGLSVIPQFAGTSDVAVAAYPGEVIDYDVTVFLRNEPGVVVVCPIFDATITITLPNGAGPFQVATGVSLNIGASITFSNVPATKYVMNEADVVPSDPKRVEAKATVSAMSAGPDTGPADDAPVNADAIGPTFLLNPSTQISITPDRTVVPKGDSVVWTVVERNDNPTGYFPVGLTSPRVELSTDGGTTTFATLTAATAGTTGDDGDGVLGAGEAWTWKVTTNPTADVTVTATGFGTGPRGRVITYPGDPDERSAASVDVINPSTVVGISAQPTTVTLGDPTTWTVTEKNDGDVLLRNPSVRLDADGGDSGDVATLTAPPASGDTNGDGVLDPGETWTWTLPTVPPVGGITVTATGHGTDPVGRDITFPLDAEERAQASVTVVPPPTLPPTGAPAGTSSAAGAGLALLLGGAALVFVATRARRTPVR